jgi:two-component system, LytTR family, sensor kinase
MTSLNSHTTDYATAQDGRFSLTKREVLLIFAFWLFLAVLTAANRRFDIRSGGFQLTFTSAPVVFAFIESFAWALITPVVFWLSRRYNLDRGNRLKSFAIFIIVGIVVAGLLAITMEELRQAIFPAPPDIRGGFGRRGGERRGGGFVPPLLVVSRLRAANNLIIYIAVLAAGLARSYSLRYRARREESVRLQTESARLEAQLAEARLEALRRQLDPHFLFNTLNAISSLVERDPRGVRRMISRLGELLRYSIEGSGEQEIPLRKELDLLQRYVDIMQVRFQGRLEVERRVDDAALDALVPNLILQPLVENALKHGVDRIEGLGRIEIIAAREGDAVVLRVRDNGPGVNGATSNTPTGIGLRNTMERLEQLYGDDAHFSLRSVDGAGAEAEVRVPFHTKDDLRLGGSESVRR